MADIFGYKRSGFASGVLSTESSQLTVGSMSGGNGAAGYLIQQWSVSYNQNLTEMFELGSDNIYWIKGRPTGQGSINRLIAFKENGSTGIFPQEAFDICNGGVSLEIAYLGGNCDNATKHDSVGTADKGVSLLMDGCVVTGMQYSSNAQQFTLAENITWRFGSMSIESTK